ncbi:MAG TPA: Gfo/Idh/MocA family oxidoreductase [Planctomycetota bacterium]|nr:Gfo/Idh/MocA family oxidoreductase [Planctomycetota bacterium]
MAASRAERIFKTDRRIRLGIWGLGRGLSFFKACHDLNIDVVAGCDFNEHMRRRFAELVPDAFVTDKAEDFLNHDMDAVLVSTFCPAHAGDAIAALKAGKHVLSEVTAFHTMAEGVGLVEAVEKSGLVYNMTENYPWNPNHAWCARKWREGLFGDFMYAECNYVHNCRSLVYTYIDGVPIIPGDRLHNWRSWLNFHYYNTHSLGPVMVITGTRPTRVVSLPSPVHLPGYPQKGAEGMGGIAPSLITMDNGGIVRNLMGSTTNDSYAYRLWGTRGAVEIDWRMGGVFLRLGGGGESPRIRIEPKGDELAELARRTGHGGGDFYVLYFFARQILTGEPAFFDVYRSADCTIPGILAYRSSMEKGKPYDVPDFRKKAERDTWRDDHYAQPHLDPDKSVFPRGADPALTQQFDATMKDLLRHAGLVRAWLDWSSVADVAADLAPVIAVADKLVAEYPEVVKTLRAARGLADVYPRSLGGRLLNEALELADEETVLSDGFLLRVKTQRRKLERSIKS